jgi:hypothetical protein
MSRFILRYTGQGAAPESDLARIRSASGVSVVDSSPRMLLVEAAPQQVLQLAEELKGWTHAPERSFPLPDPRRKVRGS